MQLNCLYQSKDRDEFINLCLSVSICRLSVTHHSEGLELYILPQFSFSNVAGRKCRLLEALKTTNNIYNIYSCSERLSLLCSTRSLFCHFDSSNWNGMCFCQSIVNRKIFCLLILFISDHMICIFYCIFLNFLKMQSIYKIFKSSLCARCIANPINLQDRRLRKPRNTVLLLIQIQKIT